jgi:epoxyqueuosine reductase
MSSPQTETKSMFADALTDDIVTQAKTQGADLVGIASVDVFQDSPKRLHPASILPGAKSVVVIAVKYPDAAIDLWCKPPAESMFFYQSVQAYMTGVIMPMIQFHVYRALERAGYQAIPVAPSGYWRYRDYQEMKGGFYADFSHRHAAVAAGLGDLGLNGLFISPEFGIRQRMASVITTAPLRPDEPYCGKPLCSNCGRCLKACPVEAFGGDERFAIRIGDKAVTYAKVDKWKCAWSEQLGMVADGGPKYAGHTTNVMPPAQVTPEDYLAARTQRDPFQASCAWGTISCGRCLHVCNAHKRKNAAPRSRAEASQPST